MTLKIHVHLNVYKRNVTVNLIILILKGKLMKVFFLLQTFRTVSRVFP